MQTSTQLSIHEKVVSMSKYNWAEEIFLELESGDSVRVGCTNDVFVIALYRYISTASTSDLDKLPESTRECLNKVMTKLYNYFNQEDN